jgi:hypothetical protein
MAGRQHCRVEKNKFMAIYRIFQTGVFEPEEIAIMSAAYEDALSVLQLANRQVRWRGPVNAIRRAYAS